jgi:hypothetical protein
VDFFSTAVLGVMKALVKPNNGRRSLTANRNAVARPRLVLAGGCDGG